MIRFIGPLTPGPEGPALIDVDAPLVLHHGTTLRAANRIKIGGFQVLDVPALTERVASGHGLTGAVVREELAKRGAHLVGDSRGTCASFAPNPAKAVHSWAQRAPEAEREALWAVYRLQHMHSDDERSSWHTDIAGHAWVWAQMRHETLAVLSFVTTYTELVALGAFTGGFGRSGLGPPDEVASAPEIAFDLPFCPSPERLVVTPIVRHLDWQIYAQVLGLSVEDFQRRHALGEFGEPMSDALPHHDPSVPVPWWDSATAPFIPPVTSPDVPELPTRPH